MPQAVTMKLEFLQRFKRRSPVIGQQRKANMLRIQSLDLTEMPNKPWTVDLTTDAAHLRVQGAMVTGFAQVKNPTNNKVLDYLFIVEVLWSNKRTTIIKRSFTDFYDFHVALVHEHRMLPKEENPMQITRFLPAWKPRRNNSIQLAETREFQLNKYVHELLRLPPMITQSQSVTAFFESRASDPKSYRYESDEDENKLTSQSDYVVCWI